MSSSLGLNTASSLLLRFINVDTGFSNDKFPLSRFRRSIGFILPTPPPPPPPPPPTVEEDAPDDEVVVVRVFSKLPGNNILVAERVVEIIDRVKASVIRTDSSKSNSCT